MKQSRNSTCLSGRKLKRLLHQLCERAQDDVRRLSQHEEAATHQLRVRMKKLLALIRLASDVIEEHTLLAMRQHIRAVKNACAGNRDRMVQGKLVDKLMRRFHLEPKNRASTSRTQAPSSSQLNHQLHALNLLIENTRIQALSERQILGQHVQSYRKGRRLMKQACETTGSETLHRWRHRVKDLYFQTLAQPHLAGARRRILRSQRLGRLLGRDQDLANLLLEPAFSMRRGPWVQVIDDHRSALRQRYLSLGHKLYAPEKASFSGRIFSAD